MTKSPMSKRRKWQNVETQNVKRRKWQNVESEKCVQIYTMLHYPSFLHAARNLAQVARNLAQDARNLAQDARNLAKDARTTTSFA